MATAGQPDVGRMCAETLSGTAADFLCLSVACVVTTLGQTDRSPNVYIAKRV